MNLSVLIIDDHALVREGLALILQQVYPGLEVLQAQAAESALSEISPSQTIDLVLMDWFLPNEDPVLNIRNLKAQWPLARLVVISGKGNLVSMTEMEAIGASGYISKTASSGAFISALRAVVHGDGCLLNPCNGAVNAPGGWDSAFGKHLSALRLASQTLTTRQKQVLNSVLRGRSNKEIARELEIAEDTVKQHLQLIYETFGVRGRTQLMCMLMQDAT